MRIRPGINGSEVRRCEPSSSSESRVRVTPSHWRECILSSRQLASATDEGRIGESTPAASAALSSPMPMSSPTRSHNKRYAVCSSALSLIPNAEKTRNTVTVKVRSVPRRSSWFRGQLGSEFSAPRPTASARSWTLSLWWKNRTAEAELRVVRCLPSDRPRLILRD